MKPRHALAVVLIVLFAIMLAALRMTYVPLDFEQEGMASWYGPGFEGRKTASGGKFITYDYTAAHRTLPLGSIVRVKNLTKGYAVTVRINDRGPYAENRIIDLSRAAAMAIGMNDGITRVNIEGISRPRSTRGDTKDTTITE